MQKTSRFDTLLAITPAILMAILLNTKLNIDLHVRFDTVLLILGNFAIAYYIAVQINKKHKNEELIKDNCFKELDFLLESLDKLRTTIAKKDNDLEDFLVRFDSLASLQIELIKKYNFISDQSKKQLSDYFYELSKHLTDSDIIDEDYKISLLRLEETILNIKSNIL